MSADVAFEILTVLAITYALYDIVRKVDARIDRAGPRCQPAANVRSSRVSHAHPIRKER
jgi:hypothetical protein